MVPAQEIPDCVLFFSKDSGLCSVLLRQPGQIRWMHTVPNFPAGSRAMQITHECRLRATILTELAKEDTELETQLLYVAQEWLTLATLGEQLNTDADGAGP
jgi:hypothetical protein